MTDLEHLAQRLLALAAMPAFQDHRDTLEEAADVARELDALRQAIGKSAPEKNIPAELARLLYADEVSRIPG